MKCIYIKTYGICCSLLENRKNVTNMVQFHKIWAKISILETSCAFNLFVTQTSDIERLNYNKTFLSANAIY